MKVNKKIKDFAREIHKAEHLFVNGKINKEHKLEEFYYLMASFIFIKLRENQIFLEQEIKKLSNGFNIVKKQMKEISKQQKYLWQSLEENRENKFEELAE